MFEEDEGSFGDVEDGELPADFLMTTFVEGESNELEKLFNPFDPRHAPQKATDKFMGFSGIFGWAPKESATPPSSANRRS